VRILTLQDYDGWMAVWRAAGLTSIRPLGRDSRDAFARQLAGGTHTLIGAEVDGDLAGVVLVTHDGRKGWLNRLAVAPAYRHLGLAARLVGEAERVLQAEGIKVYAALIEPGNEPSLRLFKKLGYVEAEAGMHYVSKRPGPDA